MEFYTSVFGGYFNDIEKPINRSASSSGSGFFLTNNDEKILSSLFKDRQISQDKVNEFLNNAKAQGNSSKMYLDKFKNRKFYDATGIIDMPLSCVGSNNPNFNTYISSINYLTVDGKIYNSTDEIKNGQNIIIDKVLLDLGYAPDAYSKSFFVVDIPNIKIKPTYDFFNYNYTGLKTYLTPISFTTYKK